MSKKRFARNLKKCNIYCHLSTYCVIKTKGIACFLFYIHTKICELFGVLYPPMSRRKLKKYCIWSISLIRNWILAVILNFGTLYKLGSLGTSNMFYRIVFSVVGGGPRVVVSTAALHVRVWGSVPGLGSFKETKNVSSPFTCESQYCGEPP